VDKWIRGQVAATVDPANLAGVFDGIALDWPEADPEAAAALLGEFRRQLDAYRPGLLVRFAQDGPAPVDLALPASPRNPVLLTAR
jgi:hypothetical protein